MTPALVVEATALCKSWQRRTGHKATLLQDAYFHVAQGEQVALMGPSGAGKSSLLHLCAGLDTAYSGTLTVLGHTLTALGDRGRAILRRRQVGFASQEGGLVHTLSVVDNITLPLWLDGHPPERARAQDLMQRLDISHLAQSAPQDLSGGEVARVALARALHHRPQLLLADEPTHALDAERRERVLGVLQAAAREGTTLLVATHDAALASALGRTLFLRGGVLENEEAS